MEIKGNYGDTAVLYSSLAGGDDESIGEGVKYILRLDKNVKAEENLVSFMRGSAEEDKITVGVYEKSGPLSLLRKIVYSFAGNIEHECMGAVIFPAEMAGLRDVSCSVRLMAEAENEKIARKAVTVPNSGKRRLSPQSLTDYICVFLSSKILKYAASSVLAFLINYTLLLILNHALPVASLEIGAFIAWAVSSLVNFAVNRTLVFRSTSSLKASLAEYYSLAAVIFLIKTYGLIELFTRVFRIPLAAASPIAEVIFFILNYIVQKKFIFGKREKKQKSAGR